MERTAPHGTDGQAPGATSPGARPSSVPQPRPAPLADEPVAASSATPPADRFRAARAAVVAADELTAAQRRKALSDLADRWLADLYGPLPTPGLALVAVGGYGRRELLPGSDLDLVLVHDGGLDPATLAQRADSIFYPVWDARVPLDHSARSLAQASEVARADLKVALGLLDARHVAGDADVTHRLCERTLADWRRDAPRRLPELRELVRARAERSGELAYLVEPDLVEAFGGLRDTVVLRAVAASWVADWPHSPAVQESRGWLLTVRDALHRGTGRGSDVLLLQEQDEVAAALGLLDADVLLRRVSEAGRAIGYASEVGWRAVDRTLRARSRLPLLRRKVTRRPLADGVVEHDGEAVLARDADVEGDATLALRAAAAAAQAGLPLSSATLERLVDESLDLPVPWPDAARDAFVRLLGAGPDGIPVWEDLESSGLVVRWLPDWERIRHRPQRTPVHRHTVDRHCIETVAEAAALARGVSRPDLLLIGALLHDIGKGWPGDHSATGAIIAEGVAARMGLDEQDVATVTALVRDHLLLPTVATTRDLDDPATVAAVAEQVGSVEQLDLLATLTEADAKAAGPAAWTPWRAGLIRDLVRRTRARLAGREHGPAAEADTAWARTLAASGAFDVMVTAPDLDQVCRVTVVAPDRVGLLAAVAGVLAVHRLDVRGASVETVGTAAVQVWRTVSAFGPPPPDDVLRRDLTKALDGTLDLRDRLERRARDRVRPAIRVAAPRVSLVPEASSTATVLQVRAHDEPGLLYRVASLVAGHGVAVRSAAVDTLGADVVDVFYLVGADGGPLPAEEAAALRDEVAEALGSRA